MPTAVRQTAARRVALVTGGARRVGRAIVQRLAADDYTVAFTFLSSEAEARELEGQIHGLAIRADLTQPQEAADTVLTQLTARFDRLDALVNNASAYKPGRLHETDVPLLRELMAVHVESPLMLCRRLAPMLRASRGRVVNMIDLLAERPWPQYLAYCASKAALANLTLGLARELAPEVTVNGIAPGVVEWPADYPQADREKYLRRVPLGRAGTPDDVARLIHFLVTDAAYVTGQIIRLDGGRSIT
jgi:pteridine reductase